MIAFRRELAWVASQSRSKKSLSPHKNGGQANENKCFSWNPSNTGRELYLHPGQKLSCAVLNLCFRWVKLFGKPVFQNLRPTEVKRKGLGEERAMTVVFY